MTRSKAERKADLMYDLNVLIEMKKVYDAKIDGIYRKLEALELEE